MNYEHFSTAAYIVSAVFFILGIKRMSKVKTARQGNAFAAFGMLIAVLVTLFNHKIVSYELIIAGILIGAMIGFVLATTVQMTAMPQMVALLNGFGGIASLLVSSSEFNLAHDLDSFTSITTFLGIFIGGVTFTGSLIAFGKLQGIVTEKSVMYPMQHFINLTLILVSVGLGYVMADQSGIHLLDGIIETPSHEIVIAIVVLALLLGVLLVIPIGGADMPVVISLLNSYSGIAAAMTGFVIQNSVLIITGSLVGASGIILTQIMCKSMNRSLLNVLLGGFGNAPAAKSGEKKDIIIKEVGVEEAAMLFETATSVIIVPGYGMAVAQAQHVVRELSELLQKRDITVKFAIHPVAGRMPGHMNVLLAEANVPYEILMEMDQINDEFANTDLALVIGANDVTNPAARHDKSSPIYGMPILNVDKARTVIINKRSMKPGYAGIENELYGFPNALMYFGDAKDAMSKLITEIKENS
ncbi:MAG: NAD(P)(+) transhydrogenase (Re/Si-specific) subunit beta [Spirochaetia bacterium]|nr:NAD(P)(+) transhydrogenase (Re/Si-specific) subunit beta [Spirochaetia bacterium]